MFSLESSQSGISPTFIAFSIIQKTFDRHTDRDGPAHAKLKQPGLSGGVNGSFWAFMQVKTFGITRGQLVAGLFLIQVITRR